MSVTDETSHEPIGPCGTLKQSVNSCRHSLIAAWSSSLEFGDHPVVGYYDRGHTFGVRREIKVLAQGQGSELGLIVLKKV